MSRAADGLAAALAKFGEVLAVGGLPEERLEAFKAHVGNGGDAFGGLAVAGADHGADADRGCGLHGAVLHEAISTLARLAALSMAPNTMARLLMLSDANVSGARP